MALEQRQQQIEVGAGQTESRLNQDFIDFLRKWSTPILLVIVAVIVGWWAFRKYTEMKQSQLARAFGDLEEQLTSGTPSPASLLGVAQDHAGQASVEHLARLTAADTWLLAGVRGVAPGAELDTTGKPKSVMSDAERSEMLTKALEQYTQVRSASVSKPALSILALRALYGQASVHESQGAWDKAADAYEAAADLAKSQHFDGLAADAAKRKGELESLKNTPALPSEAEVKTYVFDTPVPTPPPAPIDPPTSMPGLEMPSALPSFPAAPADPTAPAGQ